jgi:predicted ABC-type ATPase
MRVFAGPNGSGKSTLKSVLPAELLGVYLNPDEIEARIRSTGFLNFGDFGIVNTATDIISFLASAPILLRAGLTNDCSKLRLVEGELQFHDVEVNSYWASAAVDFIRKMLLERSATFTFETVMSHPSKVELLKEAQAKGCRTYLYFVATDDPAINVSRVRERVRRGGHSVPEDRIVSRYHRSLHLLMEAIRHSNRAYIFDNSTENATGQTWLAEITDGSTLNLKTEEVPGWFKRSVLDKISNFQ